MNRILFLALGLLLALTGSSTADEAAIQKYRNFLPEQIAALPEQVKYSEVPTMYLQAAATMNGPMGKDVVALWLNTLMYPGVGTYEEAIRAYQKDLGESPTGRLTVWQIFQLYYRSSMQQVSQVTFPMQFYSRLSKESATVQGTMMIIDEKAAFPVNYQKLWCFKSQGYCELDEVAIGFPSETDWVFSMKVMWQDTMYYKITNWSSDTITAVYEGGPEACRTTTLDLNFATKEFYAITKNLEKDCEVLGAKMERLRKPRISQIVDGEKIIRAEYSALLEKKNGFLSSQFRARFNEIGGKTDSQKQDRLR